jgi:hypothetical protein
MSSERSSAHRHPLPSPWSWRTAGPSRGAGRWSPRSTLGETAFAAIWIAVASGLALAVAYDSQHAYDSIAVLLLSNPAAAYFRNLHYWAGQVFLVLTLAHAWDHLSRWTESRVPRTMWWRVAASLPLAVFVMLSGFMLKGDAEAQQALRIVTSLLDQVPWAGPVLSAAVFGTEANRQVLYVHHVATASLLTWLFVAEHARAVWPRQVAIVETLVPIAVISLFVSPGLHEGLDPVVKGPWYFLGLQEALHWSSRPALLLFAGAVAIALLAALPRLSDRTARAAKWGLVAGLAIYGGLTVIGFAFRGENWEWTAGPPSTGLVAHGISAWRVPPTDRFQDTAVPIVLGRREGCLWCHAGMTGLSRAHGAEAVGCASCHAGNPFSLDRETAHAGVIPVPGNLADAPRSCGVERCHPSQVERVSGSLMASMAGVVAVDRAVFGTGPVDREVHDVRALGREGADGHLRLLCASCHLGAEKSSPGPVGEDARGGGCNACHLQYSTAARAALGRYLEARAAGPAAADPERPVMTVHPNVSIAIERDSCFGCHSRSGRISTNYEGWMEQSTVESQQSTVERQQSRVERREPTADSRTLRTLADGRVFEFVAADVHARNMDCIDCHTAREVMGDGAAHARAHEALRVACADCHRPPGGTGAATVVFEQLDPESRRIAELRGRNRPGERFLTTADGIEPLLNTELDAAGTPTLVAKASGQRLPLKPPATVCLRSEGHGRLSCASCHAVWAPRCPQCHTAYDASGAGIDLLDGRRVDGAWVERAGPFEALPPTLGVRAGRTGEAAGDIVDTFIPGMVMTIDRSQLPGSDRGTAFRRLYARSFSHTIGKARSCESCHADPVALGYGSGTLRFEREGERGRWRFVPRATAGPDGLPADAWTGFLQSRAAGASTRADVRPFGVDEQRHILTVGACLTCHPGTPSLRGVTASASIWRRDFKAALARLSPRCIRPAW